MQDFLHRKTQDTFQTYSLTEVSKNSEERTKTQKHDHQHQKRHVKIAYLLCNTKKTPPGTAIHCPDSLKMYENNPRNIELLIKLRELLFG